MTYKDVRTELQKNKARIIKDINGRNDLNIPWNAGMTIDHINIGTGEAEVALYWKDHHSIFTIVVGEYTIKKGDKK